LKRKRIGKRVKRKNGKKKNGKLSIVSYFLLCLIVLVFDSFLVSNQVHIYNPPIRLHC
jgi:hypothetical protein